MWRQSGLVCGRIGGLRCANPPYGLRATGWLLSVHGHGRGTPDGDRRGDFGFGPCAEYAETGRSAEMCFSHR